MTNSKVWAKELARVFRYATEVEREMQVQIVRLSVLYEDLKIEFYGAEADAIPVLDGTGVNTRRFYFVRRTLGTLVEVEGAIHQLNMNAEFKALKGKMSRERLRQWNEAAKFFSKEHEFLKAWRNDVGGHFLNEAAEYAIDEVHERTTGTIELHRVEGSAGVRLKFAYELVATALVKNKTETQPEEQFVQRAFVFLRARFKTPEQPLY